MTTYKAALAICGLSQQEAAAFHTVSLASVKHWCRGRSTPPVGVWEQLADLYRRIEDAADSASAMLEPGLMDRRVMNNVTADSGPEPLPGSGDAVAGAMALLLAIREAE